MRLALAQLNPTVGDIAGNTSLVLDAIDAARRDGADMLVAGELGLIGYPPRDLLFRHGVVEACEQAVQQIAEHARQIVVIVGHPRHGPVGEKPFRNSVSVCSNGHVLAVYDKRLFPGYDVFDEDRYFEAGQSTCIVEVAGQRVGVLICEDLWRAQDALAERRYPLEPVRETIQAGCDVLISLNATPFVLGKRRTRLDLLRRWARSLSVPAVAVHQVGANDDLIFDGHSVAVAGDGSVIEVLPGWASCVRTIELGPDARGSDAANVNADQMHELWSALVLGVKDYCRKTGNEQVVIGLSGGIDSSVTACVAAAALGVGNVLGLLLPSRYSSPASEEDAKQLESNLGLPRCPTIAIESVHLAVHNALAAFLGQRAGGVTDENIQARVRGVLLMAFTNANGALLLATANKS
ncbi:MAG: NAD(+) synthase, partial [Phycisphaerales bacterium]